MGYARLRVSFELLREALHLPTDTEIEFAVMPSTASWNEMELTVSHPELRDVPIQEGELPPMAKPTFRKQEPVVFVDWGQE